MNESPHLVSGERLICGDIHGKIEVVEAMAATGKQLIFLGDFLDDYVTTPWEQVACVRRVCGLVETGQARFVLGNHEYSYLNPGMRCSGYKANTDDLVLCEKGRLMSLADSFLRIDDVLITHAGVHNAIWQKYGLALDHLEWRFREAMAGDTRDSWYYQVGFSRGGGHNYGGPLWCDWNDEFVYVAGVRQVVGHTRSVRPGSTRNFKQVMVGPHRTNENGDWCIDTLDREPCVLHMSEDGKFTPFYLDKHS